MRVRIEYTKECEKCGAELTVSTESTDNEYEHMRGLNKQLEEELERKFDIHLLSASHLTHYNNK